MNSHNEHTPRLPQPPPLLEGLIVTPESLESAGSAPRECFKAGLVRAAKDISPGDIPEDFEAVRFPDYTCSFVNGEGKACKFADPMVFMKQHVGFVAMGSANFCRLEADSPRDFNKAALGGLGIRAMRLGRKIGSLVKQKLAK